MLYVSDNIYKCDVEYTGESRRWFITGWLLAAGLTPEYRHLAG